MTNGIKNKGGQVTIFIILAIVVIVSIVGFYILSPKTSITINPKENPQGYIEQCLYNSAKESSEKIFALGGSKNATNYLLFNKTNIRFLCHTDEIKTLCTTEEPLLKRKMEESIQADSLSNIENCFKKLKESLSNYDYKEDSLEYTIEILPETIKATAKKKMTISRDGESQTFNMFVSESYNPAYNFILITNEILRDEIDCQCGTISCTSDITLLSQTNTRFRLGLDVTPKMNRVYSIQDRTTNQEFKFAVRNCIIE